MREIECQSWQYCIEKDDGFRVYENGAVLFIIKCIIGIDDESCRYGYVKHYFLK